MSPLSNITVRMQTAKVEGAEEKKEAGDSSDDEDSTYGTAPTTLDIARDIYAEKGWTGFWSGEFRFERIDEIAKLMESRIQIFDSPRAPFLNLGREKKLMSFSDIDHQSRHHVLPLRRLQASCHPAAPPGAPHAGADLPHQRLRFLHRYVHSTHLFTSLTLANCQLPPSRTRSSSPRFVSLPLASARPDDGSADSTPVQEYLRSAPLPLQLRRLRQDDQARRTYGDVRSPSLHY